MTRPFFENKAFRDEVLSKIKLGRLGQLDRGGSVAVAPEARVAESELHGGSPWQGRIRDR